MGKDKLLKLSDLDCLSIKDLHKHYRRFVNPGQVDLIASFGFVRDMVGYAEGCWIHTKNWKELEKVAVE